VWHRALHLIDHGAALTFHHSWTLERLDEQRERFAAAPYSVADHALVECAPDVAGADAELSGLDWAELVGAAVAAVPGEWLVDALPGGPDGSVGEAATRAAYRDFLLARVAARGEWVPELVEAVARGAARDEAGRRVPERASSGPPAWIPELRLGREGST
jgi:hypothetical protein